MSAAQSLREASVTNVEGQRANTEGESTDAGPTRANTDPSRVTRGQREAERR